MPKKHDIIEITGEVLHETEDAYLFTDGTKEKDGKNTVNVWLPKSQCEWDKGDKTMQLPEWLALDKGLI
jgi:hypothetical protein